MKMIIEIDDDTYNSLDLYVRNDSKGKGVIHNCLHAIKNGIPVNENDLGVDCISRTSALDSINWAYNLSDAYQKINDLPSVTPIRPKGHWIKIGDRGLGWSDTVICKCSECEHQEEFTGKFDGHNLVIDKERADNYCSNCGADMREVVEE